MYLLKVRQFSHEQQLLTHFSVLYTSTKLHYHNKRVARYQKANTRFCEIHINVYQSYPVSSYIARRARPSNS